MNHFEASDFEFVICAYKESPYLEECICSFAESGFTSKNSISNINTE